jgi:hypothetical protein
MPKRSFSNGIEINEDWGFKSDERQWTLCKNSNGNLVPFRYYTSLKGLLNGLYEVNVKASDYSSFGELIQNMKESRRMISNFVDAHGLDDSYFEDENE